MSRGKNTSLTTFFVELKHEGIKETAIRTCCEVGADREMSAYVGQRTQQNQIITKYHPKPVPYLSYLLIGPSLFMCTCEESAGWNLSQDPDALCQHPDSRKEAGLYRSRLYTQPEPAKTRSQERTTCSI